MDFHVVAFHVKNGRLERPNFIRSAWVDPDESETPPLVEAEHVDSVVRRGRPESLTLQVSSKLPRTLEECRCNAFADAERVDRHNPENRSFDHVGQWAAMCRTPFRQERRQLISPAGAGTIRYDDRSPALYERGLIPSPIGIDRPTNRELVALFE